MIVNKVFQSSTTTLFKVSCFIISNPWRSSPFASCINRIAHICSVGKRFLKFWNSFEIRNMQSLDLSVKCFINSNNIFKMTLAYFQIFSQLLINLLYFIIFAHDEVNVLTRLSKLRIHTCCFHFLCLPLFTKGSPFLFLSRKLFHSFSNLIFKFFLL